ncbi:MAG: hypothetical protein OJF47_002683 [Nitrospira sp.]|jgi:hypothetical protein|nr:MAG: hypothetical protein OJF47_002683 [Nitrospira sp.]
MMSSNRVLLRSIVVGLVAGGATVLWSVRVMPETAPISLPVETVAEYLHAVIEADRDIYTRQVVERMQAKGVVLASENWEQRHTLPLPAQFLMESGRYIAKKGLGIQYRLISLWPINKRNAAATEFEKTALGAILTHPAKPHTGFVKDGGVRGPCSHPGLYRLPQRPSGQSQTGFQAQ